MRRLAAAPKDAVALLRQHVAPVAAPDAARVAKSIADLDSEQFDVRAAAEQALDAVGETALPACRAALAKARSVELRRRLEGFIAKQTRAQWQPNADRLRKLRAVEVLEMAGTAACRAMLEKLGRGAAGRSSRRKRSAACGGSVGETMTYAWTRRCFASISQVIVSKRHTPMKCVKR